MSLALSGDTVEYLMGLGLSGEQMRGLIDRLQRDALAMTPPAALSGVNEEREYLRNQSTYAERKRAKDRERQRRLREEARQSRDVADDSRDIDGDAGDGSRDTSDASPSPLPSSPQTPQLPTPTPPDINTRARGIAAKPNGFARFWEAYPNKTGKLAAEKAYARALKTIPGPDPPSLLLAGVERAKASREWGEGFIPHPTTWLNQGRWDDEPAEVIPLHGTRHERPHPDKRATAYAERLGDIGAAMEAAVQQRRGGG